MLLFFLVMVCHLASSAQLNTLTICAEIDDPWKEGSLKVLEEFGYDGIPIYLIDDKGPREIILVPGGVTCTAVCHTETTINLIACQEINIKITSVITDAKTYNLFDQQSPCVIDNGNAIVLTGEDYVHEKGTKCGDITIELPPSGDQAEVYGEYDNSFWHPRLCAYGIENAYGYDYRMVYGSILLLICILALFNCWCINEIIKHKSKVNTIKYSKVQSKDECDQIL
eukprot:958682_1